MDQTAPRATEASAFLGSAGGPPLARSRLLLVVAEVSTLLARSPVLQDALVESLRRLGEAAGLDRVALLEERVPSDTGRPPSHHVVAEWCAPGTPDHAALGMRVIRSDVVPEWLERLRRGDAFWAQMPVPDAPQCDVMRRLRVEARGCAPLFVDGAYAGAVAFDHCAAPHEWDEAEVAALTAGANAIAAALQSRRHAERLAAAREKAARAQVGERARDAAVAAAVARERQAAAEERASALAAEVERRAHAERVAMGQAAVLTRAVERLAAASADPASVPSTAAAVRDALLAAVVEQLGGTRVDLWDFDLARDECRLAITCHADGRVIPVVDQPSHPGSQVIPLAAMRGSPGYVAVERGECLRVGPDYDHPTHAPFRAWMDEQGLRSALQVPVRVGGVARAVFFVLFVDDRPFPPAERELAMAVGHLLALAFEAERLAAEARTAARQSAVLEERTRIARELHDTVAQGLTGIVMQLGAVRDKLADAGDVLARVAAPLERATKLAEQNLAAARRAIMVLRPDAGADEGIAPALVRMVAEARQDWLSPEGGADEGGEGPRLDDRRPLLAHDVRGTPRRVAPEVEFELARIAQAAIANAVRHAAATTIVVTLDFAPGPGDGIRITVADDGVGFDPGAPMDGHFGLVGMRERAARIGASMTVVTAPGEGTEVVVMWTGGAS